MGTPYKKPKGGKLLDRQKEFNTAINRIRYIVEREIGNFKVWRIMHTDYRRPEHTYLVATCGNVGQVRVGKEPAHDLCAGLQSGDCLLNWAIDVPRNVLRLI